MLHYVMCPLRAYVVPFPGILHWPVRTFAMPCPIIPCIVSTVVPTHPLSRRRDACPPLPPLDVRRRRPLSLPGLWSIGLSDIALYFIPCAYAAQFLCT